MTESEDEEMMSCAEILLELQQLIFMSEFREAWRTSGPVWGRTKKRSAVPGRKRRTSFSESFNWGNKVAGGSSRLVPCGPSNFDENMVGKTMMKNPNSSDLDTKKALLSPFMIVYAGKKRRNCSDPDTKKTPLEIIKEQKPLLPSNLKVKFKLNRGNGLTTTTTARKVAAEKDSLPPASGSGESNESLSLVSCDQVSNSSSVLVDNNNAAEMKKSIQDLNVSINMTEEEPQPQSPMQIQNNNNNKSTPSCCNFVCGGNNHVCYVSNDRVAAAKENRMARWMKLKERKSRSKSTSP